jgi:hypothetical protein
MIIDYVSVKTLIFQTNTRTQFWHKREDVMSRLEVYLQTRIPELMSLETDSSMDDYLED